MLRLMFGRTLLLTFASTWLAAFIASVSIAEPFVTDARLAIVALIVAVLIAPPVAALHTVLLGRKFQRLKGEQAAQAEREARGLAQEAGVQLEEAARLREALEEIEDGVLLVDASRRIVLANAMACRLLGQHALEGMLLLEGIRAPGLLELVEGGGGQIELEAAGPRPHLLIRSRPVAHGGTLLMLRDVGALRRLEQVRQDFVANVSHELRTPVAAVKANVETLLGGALDDAAAARGFAEAISRNASRIAQLIEDLLELSQMDHTQAAAPRESLGLRALCLEVCRALRASAEARAVTVKVAVDETLVVQSERLALTQIVQNLVDNAIRHGREGGRVVVDARALEAGVALTVEDDGPGIEARHRGRIFERFYRVDPGRSRAVGGTGLGLSIVRNRVESLGGTIRVDEATPSGSVFRVVFPQG